MGNYNNWFEYNVIERLREIKDPLKRLQFIFDMKMDFVKMGDSNSDVPMALEYFETLIEREKFAVALQSEAIKESVKSNITNIAPEEFLDFSKNSIAERIVIMKELGILDYLQIKMNQESVGFSANKLAELLSSFTNVSQSTLQSYLNPLISRGVKERNSPLTPNNIKKAHQKLLKIGFKIK